MKAEQQTTTLPEVILLFDARGARPENAAGVGGFWYEPEVWALPLSPTSKVLYTSLCSFLGHGQINRRDLRGALENRTDEEIARNLEELVRHKLLVPADRVTNSDTVADYEVRSIGEFEG
ncbi:MAG: hypothetical protein AVDCRST_MAG78-13 [uncultured Rubrobacteraceae bacterium]|uniref:Uncharacterized protein n=1 Tax=uncultured Rubrobacteraceae bacterium TaxID=349277 RepID=A0A6J4P3Z0_9ACTN|nr:MAG: hypothetical protein AVDCRST_MAG78-13 [uncultured Rubrobacteraceae bacterium]